MHAKQNKTNTSTTDGVIASLPALLSQLKTYVSDFVQLLDQELEILQKFAPEALDALSQVLAQKSQQVETINQQTLRILKTAEQQFPNQFDTSEPSLQHLLQLNLPSSEQQLLQEVLTLTETFYQKNLRNGMIIQSLSNINQQALMALKGKDNQYTGYTAQGTKQTPTTQTTMLGKA